MYFLIHCLVLKWIWREIEREWAQEKKLYSVDFCLNYAISGPAPPVSSSSLFSFKNVEKDDFFRHIFLCIDWNCMHVIHSVIDFPSVHTLLFHSKLDIEFESAQARFSVVFRPVKMLNDARTNTNTNTYKLVNKIRIIKKWTLLSKHVSLFLNR